LDAACAGATPSKTIPASTLARAIEFTRWLHDQTRLLYGELGESVSPEASLVLRFVARFKGCGAVSLKQCRSWWPTRRKPSMSEIREFVNGVVQLGYARWVDPQHVEIVNGSHLRRFVTQEPKTLARSGSEQVTKASSPLRRSSSPVVTPMHSSPTQSGLVASVSSAEEQLLPEPSDIEIAPPSSGSHGSHRSPVVHKKPETRSGRGFKPVTTRSHPVVTGSHLVVHPKQPDLPPESMPKPSRRETPSTVPIQLPDRGIEGVPPWEWERR
jgi:hypothetical protein